MPILLALLTFSVQVFALSGQDLSSDKTIQIQPGKSGLVAVFLSTRCPCSNSHLETVKKLAADFHEFQFVGIHSNTDEPSDESKAYFSKAGLPFPVLQDESSKLANQFKAAKTPHAFVIVNEKTVYKGGVTDSSEALEAKRQYLREALVALRANQPIATPETRSLGCVISR